MKKFINITTYNEEDTSVLFLRTISKSLKVLCLFFQTIRTQQLIYALLCVLLCVSANSFLRSVWLKMHYQNSVYLQCILYN